MCDKVRGMYEKGFGEFYSVTHDALYRYIWGKMGTDVMIEDIMQETYYKAYENREMLESHPNVVGWLFKTANFRKTIRAFRWKKFRKQQGTCIHTEDMKR